ncbi:hypothetical protein BGZ95_007815, partial [Linnemannia exigua]
PKETLSFDADDEVDQPTIASASTSRKDSQKSSASKDRFTKEDFDRVLSWLEHEPNFVLIHGTSGQTSVGKPTRTATSSYSTLATLVSRHSKGRLNLTGRAMRERFQRHKTKYKSIRELSSHTGFGIYTLAGKLESLCTCYQRISALYGRKPNVKPLVEVSIAKHDTIRELSSEDGEDQDIGGLDDNFIDNDNDNDNDNYNYNYNYDDDNDNGDNDGNVERLDDNNNDGPGLEGPVLDPAAAFDLKLDAIFGPVVTDHPDVVEVPAASNPASMQQ